MEAEATEFYLRNYIDSFSAPDIDVALASVPQARRAWYCATGACTCAHAGKPACAGQTAASVRQRKVWLQVAA